MTTISLRIPDSLHQVVKKLVKQEGISINQFITLALAEKVSALATQEYLEERAKRGDRTKFVAAMRKVADIEPADERDRI
ncbi:MAG: toxin-antitoxin system HicB family antitoxin [Chloroflexi bacterium]|nr:MAG: toxin-antitoxin system HicB family antitoxin [Chloroflexota bacterium]